MKADTEFSFIDSDLILEKTRTSLFRDMDPRIPSDDTHFRKCVAKADTAASIVDTGTTPMDVIHGYIEDTVIKRHNIDGKINHQEPTLLEMSHLSVPKGEQRLCELCSREANFCCRDCLVTFYCCISHRRKDIVHRLICPRLRIIRAPTVFKSTAVDRRRFIGQRSYVMEKLLDDLFRQSYGFIYKNKHEEALITLNHCPKLLPKLYGKGKASRQLALIFVAMCEAYVGMGDYQEADLMVKRAFGEIHLARDLDTEGNFNFITAYVYYAQGKLSYVVGLPAKAIVSFSEYIYYIAEELDPYHIKTSMGYFNLAKSFLKKGNTGNAYHLFSFCADLWVEFLYDILMTLMSRDAGIDPSMQLGGKEEETMPFMTQLEFRKNLIEMWNHVDEASHKKLACQTILCEGILSFIDHHYKEARNFAARAINIATNLQPEEKGLFLKLKNLNKFAGRRTHEGGDTPCHRMSVAF